MLQAAVKGAQLDFYTSSSTAWHNARNWRMRAEETRALADQTKETEPRAVMLRIAADYERLAAWAEKSPGGLPHEKFARPKK